jgi:hypothetical protein
MYVSYRQWAAAQLLVLFLLHSAATLAGNTSFVSDAPIGRFTEEDLKLMNDNIDAALADQKLLVVHSWTNPQTKNSGTAEALRAFSGPNGIPCKRVRVTNRADSLKGQGQYTLCKMEGQGWTYVPKDFASPAQSKPAN